MAPRPTKRARTDETTVPPPPSEDTVLQSLPPQQQQQQQQQQPPQQQQQLPVINTQPRERAVALTLSADGSSVSSAPSAPGSEQGDKSETKSRAKRSPAERAAQQREASRRYRLKRKSQVDDLRRQLAIVEAEKARIAALHGDTMSKLSATRNEGEKIKSAMQEGALMEPPEPARETPSSLGDQVLFNELVRRAELVVASGGGASAAAFDQDDAFTTLERALLDLARSDTFHRRIAPPILTPALAGDQDMVRDTLVQCGFLIDMIQRALLRTTSPVTETQLSQLKEAQSACAASSAEPIQTREAAEKSLRDRFDEEASGRIARASAGPKESVVAENLVFMQHMETIRVNIRKEHASFQEFVKKVLRVLTSLQRAVVTIHLDFRRTTMAQWQEAWRKP
jgi:hypothetical protein